MIRHRLVRSLLVLGHLNAHRDDLVSLFRHRSLPLVLPPGEIALHLHLLKLKFTLHLSHHFALCDPIGVWNGLGIGKQVLESLANVLLLLLLVHPHLVVVGIGSLDLSFLFLLGQEVASEATVLVNHDGNMANLAKRKVSVTITFESGENFADLETPPVRDEIDEKAKVNLQVGVLGPDNQTLDGEAFKTCVKSFLFGQATIIH